MDERLKTIDQQRQLDCLDSISQQAKRTYSPDLRRQLLKAACQLLEHELFPEMKSKLP